LPGLHDDVIGVDDLNFYSGSRRGEGKEDVRKREEREKILYPFQHLFQKLKWFLIVKQFQFQ
jgi:hypothetical protein